LEGDDGSSNLGEAWFIDLGRGKIWLLVHRTEGVRLRKRGTEITRAMVIAQEYEAAARAKSPVRQRRPKQRIRIVNPRPRRAVDATEAALLLGLVNEPYARSKSGHSKLANIHSCADLASYLSGDSANRAHLTAGDSRSLA